MTRLSDSLRGLADRAPVDAVGISTSAATRRIYRGRRLRAAANATAGVGVAAVIALAAINPATTSADSNVAAAGAPESDKLAGPAFDMSGASELAWGQCGTQLFDAEVPAVTDAWSLKLGEIGTDVDLGSTVTAPLTATRSGDPTVDAYTTTGPTFMVLWNGVVVGTAVNPVIDSSPQDLSDDEAILDSQIDLVNCWDGTALPAGSYELVAYLDFYPSAPALPVVEPVVEPTLMPLDPEGIATDVVPFEAAVERAVSNTVPFTVAGEVPEDPFGAYLTPAAPAIVYPDDYLTPSAAREEFDARSTASVWTMEAGTQRVVKSGDSAAGYDEDAWLNNYYGCSADGTSTQGFPATSADWSLLNVEAPLPSSVGVSYGWVVDGNPEVTVSLTNTSGHTLPGFWGEPSGSLYLVKDGQVVATSYLSPVNQYGTAVSPSSDGLLSPAAVLSGTYLWRDVSACWLGDAQGSVAAGTYTVLTLQEIYLDNGTSGYGGPIMYSDVMRSEGDAGGGNPLDKPAIQSSPEGVVDAGDTSMLIAPAPVDENYDWLSLQVWTSLGQVTIT